MKDADRKDRLADAQVAGEAIANPSLAKADQSPAATLDIQAYIGTRLREVYDDVASQPIPDRFLDLMRQLDKA